MRRSRSVFLWIITSGAILALMLVWFAGYSHGPRFTYDSINYIYAGHALIEKGEFLRPHEQPYIEWPPLYPMLIAALDVFPGNLLLKILVIQAIIMSVTVGLSIKLAYNWIKEPFVFGVFCMAIVFSTPLLVVNHFVWSESLFCLLTVIQLSVLIHYIQYPRPLSLVDLMLAGMLLCLQRHVGIFFIIGTSIAIWLYTAEVSLIRRFQRGVLYGLVSIIPLLLWWARNYLVKGQIMNDYSETIFSVGIGEHFLAFHQVLTAWFLPNKLPVLLRIGLLYSVIIWLVVFIKRSLANSNKALKTVSYDLIDKSRITGVLTVFFLSYFLLAYAASFTVNEYIDDRILAPVYVTGMLLFFGLVDQYLMTFTKPRVKKYLVYICLLWTLYPLARSLSYVNLWHSQPVYLPYSQPVEERVQYLFHF
ncbi:hypothetical protein GXP67_18255 [Rhodocytophaga rosea]|uniref:Glycosyltransferase family 39 protein n=1 Tax=Rhodocytophaga rosea TaxID=2704465 RepID=A0A6C0GK83_9BACT|nr:hypothetical protein [Rhodocytophaga rosea]QHT68446.1 hypothetical protein GXP67_18255 [Rhodocytophaga rosea]